VCRLQNPKKELPKLAIGGGDLSGEALAKPEALILTRI
jgi:hypothetical protein